MSRRLLPQIPSSASQRTQNARYRGIEMDLAVDNRGGDTWVNPKLAIIETDIKYLINYLALLWRSIQLLYCSKQVEIQSYRRIVKQLSGILSGIHRQIYRIPNHDILWYKVSDDICCQSVEGYRKWVAVVVMTVERLVDRESLHEEFSDVLFRLNNVADCVASHFVDPAIEAARDSELASILLEDTQNTIDETTNVVEVTEADETTYMEDDGFILVEAPPECAIAAEETNRNTAWYSRMGRLMRRLFGLTYC